MKNNYKIALIGQGFTNAQIDRLQEHKNEIDSQMVGFEFSDEEYFRSILGIILKDKINNTKTYILELAQRYPINEFSRKKKPKNQEWQNRIKNLMKK